MRVKIVENIKQKKFGVLEEEGIVDKSPKTIICLGGSLRISMSNLFINRLTSGILLVLKWGSPIAIMFMVVVFFTII